VLTNEPNTTIRLVIPWFIKVRLYLTIFILISLRYKLFHRCGWITVGGNCATLLICFYTALNPNKWQSLTWSRSCYPFGSLEFTSSFDGFRVLNLYCFVDHRLSFSSIPIGHCIVWLSANYGLWLPFWYHIFFFTTNFILIRIFDNKCTCLNDILTVDYL
jgi:hypothetical protein